MPRAALALWAGWLTLEVVSNGTTLGTAITPLLASSVLGAGFGLAALFVEIAVIRRLPLRDDPGAPRSLRLLRVASFTAYLAAVAALTFVDRTIGDAGSDSLLPLISFFAVLIAAGHRGNAITSVAPRPDAVLKPPRS